jgi:hypothetical protein
METQMTTMATPLRRLLPAAFVAATVALGTPATASATWDIELYDDCMYLPTSGHAGDVAYCCVYSGGELSGGKCVAPASDEFQGPTETPIPPRKFVVPTVPGVQPPIVGIG